MQKFSIDDSPLTSEYGIHIGRWEQYAAASGLPFSAMWCQVPANSHSVLDNHPEVELAVVVGGDAVFTVNGEDTPAPAGSAILLTPGDRHVITAGDEPVRILSIYWLPGDAGSIAADPEGAKAADDH
ncbi:cupin domain-containing protein [Streptomyces sp. H10-C2]|uniref:cupin domain-containing protein n=1 Tax=unclassified Streptomyces TaxID=2593676 RepID=UPI0024B92CBB|nr:MULTISPECIES: cupin domain-containing protein [unclassified Streptomyces]MDJ0346006.1 cupin domain-containing protein [Streptomyces sp. PH10-H1]MDJ0370487.1 cupin domain-containing protein [Streptomyces sp. H10-C2]